MLPAILGAIGTAAGVAGGITTGTSTSSTSTLSPEQQAMSYLTMMAMAPELKGHFSTLASLGQQSPNTYEALPNFGGEYVNKVLTPSMQRQRGMVGQIGDPAHRRSSNISRDRFRTEQRLSNNQLKTSLMLKDLGMQSQGLSDSLNRKLGNLSMMTDAWSAPMGRSRENYMMQDQTLNNIAGGIQGAKSLYQAGQNIYDQYILSSPPAVGSYSSGAGGGF